MSNILLTLGSIVAYIVGLIVMLKMTPKILERSYDEGLFMLIAAANIIGAILAFGGVIVTYGVYNANVFVKIFDFLLLMGILLVSIRLALFSLRSRVITGTNRISRIISGAFCLGLAVASVYYMIQLFIPS